MRAGRLQARRQVCIRRLSFVPEVEQGSPGVQGAVLAKGGLAGLRSLNILLAETRKNCR